MENENSSLLVEWISGSGGWLISEVRDDGYYVKRRYFDYSREEAIEEFRAEFCAESEVENENTEKWDVVYTDATHDGEGWNGNFCWVDRQVVETRQGASQREVMKAAKAAVGLTGVRGTTYSWGNSLDFKPYKYATLLFVSEHYEVES